MKRCYGKYVAIGVSASFALVYSLALAAPASAVQVTQNFDSDPGWAGNKNTEFGNNDYGFSDTDNAGGTAGEAGGAISSRTAELTSYADNNIGSLNQQVALSASGVMTSVGDLTGFDGGFEFGWFDVNQTTLGMGGGVGGPASGIAMRVLENSAVTYRVQARFGNNATPNLTLDTDTDYEFALAYDPAGGGENVGRLELTVTGFEPVGVNGPSDGTPYDLNAFGFTTLDFNTDTPAMDFFVDNLEYTADAAAVPGDYNGNGDVDAADYVLWRKGGPLQNEVDNEGTVDQQDYIEWRARFGNPPSSGSGSVIGAVPEPATALLSLLACLATVAAARGRR